MSYQIHCNLGSIGASNFPRRLQDAFQTPLDAPAWCPRGPKSHPRGAQDAPRTAQELPKRRPGSGPQAPWGEDTPQRTPRLPPDLDCGPFWPQFGRSLGSSCMDFQKDFQANWIDVLATIRWQCWGGCAPTPTLLSRATVAGTPLCGVTLVRIILILISTDEKGKKLSCGKVSLFRSGEAPPVDPGAFMAKNL